MYAIHLFSLSPSHPRSFWRLLSSKDLKTDKTGMVFVVFNKTDPIQFLMKTDKMVFSFFQF
jgi:hypothetical protein